MNRQHVLHLLPLPKELITIIKDYAFPTKIYLHVRKYKKVIVNQIELTTYKMSDIPNHFWFWTECYLDPQHQSYFCLRCGNYSNELNEPYQDYEKVKCQCALNS